jgi:DDE superfamily endonuclease
VSIIECIGTNGYPLPAFVIFQGQRIQESRVNIQMDKQTILRVSDNGWTDRDIALDWLKHFDLYTKPQIRGKYRLLILNGHTSHVSVPFIEFCEQQCIIPLCLPPHSTHVLQPLDVGIFSPLAKAYKTHIQQHSVFGAERITNEQFLKFFQLARQEAISLGNIASAWRAAGLKPFNPTPILQKHRPKIPPSVSFTNEDGVSIEIQLQPDLAEQVNKFVGQFLQGCATPAE